MKYFVSYTTRDKEITLNLLNEYSDFLKTQGKVFVDLLHNDSISKQERIFKEIEKCDVLIVLVTDNVFKSEWVLLEIEYAKKLQKKIVTVPFNIIWEHVMPPQSHDKAISQKTF